MVSSERLKELFTLNGEARELTGDPEACRRHILGRLATLLDSPLAVLAEFDMRKGPMQDRVRCDVHQVDAATCSVLQVLDKLGSDFDPLLAECTRRYQGARHLIRAHMTEDLIGRQAWRNSPYYVDSVKPSGLDDHLMSLRSFETPAQMFAFAFYRERGRPPFTDEDKLFLELVELGLGEMLHRPAAAPQVDVLSPRQRDTLDQILRGHSAKEIADRLGLSIYTVNEYTTEVYRRLGVRSRAELFARFLPNGKASALKK
jgi:DNA-binding CsgD family transcriptional regulator